MLHHSADAIEWFEQYLEESRAYGNPSVVTTILPDNRGDSEKVHLVPFDEREDCQLEGHNGGDFLL